MMSNIQKMIDLFNAMPISTGLNVAEIPAEVKAMADEHWNQFVIVRNGLQKDGVPFAGSGIMLVTESNIADWYDADDGWRYAMGNCATYLRARKDGDDLIIEATSTHGSSMSRWQYKANVGEVVLVQPHDNGFIDIC